MIFSVYSNEAPGLGGQVYSYNYPPTNQSPPEIEVFDDPELSTIETYPLINPKGYGENCEPQLKDSEIKNSSDT